MATDLYCTLAAIDFHHRAQLLQADGRLLAPKGGFFGGMGERGVGGSKCGATAAVALLFPGERGATQLLAANVGDARVLLCRRGKAVQLTVDHVPDRFACLQVSDWCCLTAGTLIRSTCCVSGNHLAF